MSLKITPITLKKLEQVFEEGQYIIRYEKGNFNSGYCVLEQKRVVVVNKFLNLEGKINALLEIMPKLSIDKDLLSEANSKIYQSVKQSSAHQMVQSQLDI